MMQQDSSYQMVLPAPAIDLGEVFSQIKAMQKDNLNDMPVDSKDDKVDQEIKGLKFIAKKIKVLLQKNKKIQYNQASRILISNFANEQRDERNIKRRVYDAINVLVSAGVITKDDSKIQLVSEKKQSLKYARNNNKQSKQQLQEQIKLKSERLHQKKTKLQIMKERLRILKKVYSDKNKKSKKQQFMAFLWNGKAETVTITKKKDIVVKIEQGKLVQFPSTLIDYICYIDPKYLKSRVQKNKS